MAREKIYPSESQDRYIVRFPDGMRDKIAELAKANGRSMNAEIVARLERSFASELPGSQADALDTLGILAASLSIALDDRLDVDDKLRKEVLGRAYDVVKHVSAKLAPSKSGDHAIEISSGPEAKQG